MTIGKPISPHISWASISLLATSLVGCFKFKELINFWNLSLSSAKSIAFTEVPRILTPDLSNSFAILRGVCPPSWTITPSNLPFCFSLKIISKTFSLVNGSK